MFIGFQCHAARHVASGTDTGHIVRHAGASVGRAAKLIAFPFNAATLGTLNAIGTMSDLAAMSRLRVAVFIRRKPPGYVRVRLGAACAPFGGHRLVLNRTALRPPIRPRRLQREIFEISKTVMDLHAGYLNAEACRSAATAGPALAAERLSGSSPCSRTFAAKARRTRSETEHISRSATALTAACR
jgi:hypothetical protein